MRTIAAQAGEPPARPKAGPRPPVGGSAAPKAVTPGDNAVYRIEPDGVAREVFRAKALIFALAWSGGPPPGRHRPRGPALRGPRPGRRDARRSPSSTTARSSRCWPSPDGGDPPGHGRSRRRSSGSRPASSPRASSSPRSTTPSSSAASAPCRWRADLPAGTSLTVQVRTGNVGEPDDDLVGLVGRPDRPPASRGRVAPRPVRPVPGQARDHGPRAHAGALERRPRATSRATCPPRSPARRPRRQRRRRRPRSRPG